MNTRKEKQWTIIREYQNNRSSKDCVQAIIRRHLSMSQSDIYPQDAFIQNTKVPDNRDKT